jgi:hypothetical protein
MEIREIIKEFREEIKENYSLWFMGKGRCY